MFDDLNITNLTHIRASDPYLPCFWVVAGYR